jgi:hypothetical protein
MFSLTSAIVLAAMAIPYGLNALGYQFYFVNACFDVLMVIFVLFVWVETRGLTLEEVDKLFDSEKRETVIEHVKEEVGVNLDRAEDKTATVTEARL